MSALLLASVVPSGAAPSEPDDPWLFWVASDGTHGVRRQSEVLPDDGSQDWHQAGFQHCYRTAPLENACTLRAYTTWPAPGGWWGAGWFQPTLPHHFAGDLIPEAGAAGSAGALVASTQLVAIGDFDPAVILRAQCTWATVAVFGTGPASGPFFSCVIEYDCPYIGRFDCIPRGNITADFHTGVYDPSLLEKPVGPLFPSTGNTEAGVGTWHAILGAT